MSRVCAVDGCLGVPPIQVAVIRLAGNVVETAVRVIRVLTANVDERREVVDLLPARQVPVRDSIERSELGESPGGVLLSDVRPRPQPVGADRAIGKR